MANSLRVCYFGTYRSEYSRNQIMIEGLRRAGADVLICHEPLWHGIEDRIQIASGGWINPNFWYRVIITYIKLLWRIIKLKDFDILIVGYPGQIDIFIARIICWIKRKPLVWDIFMSIYLIAIERGLSKKNRFSINLIRKIERIACILSNMLIIDTIDYARWFNQTYHIPFNKFRMVPTGADDTKYYPIETIKKDPEKLSVIYYGTFIPNHGVRYIVEAANILKDKINIRFELIGNGPLRDDAELMALNLFLNNIKFTNWLNPVELIQKIANADICLGVFGVTPQSMMTIQNKIYISMAMKKPIISGFSPVINRTFKHGEQIYLCDRANPESIAAAILVLMNDSHLRYKIAKLGHEAYLARYTTQKIGERFFNHLIESQFKH